MRVHVFTTDDGTEKVSGPLQYVPDDPKAFMLGHPRCFGWRYFATVAMEDTLLGLEPRSVRTALLDGRAALSRVPLRKEWAPSALH